MDFLCIFLCVTSGETTWTLTVFNWSFHMFQWRKPLQESLCFPHVIVTEAILSISFISDAVFLSVKENNASELFLHISHYKCTITYVSWLVLQRVMAIKLTEMRQNIMILQQVVVQRCTACCCQFCWHARISGFCFICLYEMNMSFSSRLCISLLNITYLTKKSSSVARGIT